MKKTRSILIKEVATGSSIELGINPESITVSESRDNIKENIDAIGDVYFPGKRGLKSVSISTFLPGSKSKFRRRGSLQTELELINRWISEDVILRVVISKPTINFKAILDSKSITVKEGDLDVYIDLKLTEVKDIEIPTVESVSILKKAEDTAAGSTDVTLSDRGAENAPKAGNVEIVNSKTTLWGLAKKYYGNGEEWKKISEANGGIDPKKLREGMQILIP
jgi:putative tail tape measure protein|nr:MAG TPA: tail assembly protein [Caudoviricetes sp.]